MKAELKTVIQEFEPVELNIVIESVKEYQVLNALFAYDRTVTNSLYESNLLNKSQSDLLMNVMQQIQILFEENN
jgi:hypothetical protein